MLTEIDYCDYDTSVALKELGYVGICDAYYEQTGSEDYNREFFRLSYTSINRVAAPLLYQAHKFLREEKGLHIEIDRVGYDWLVSVIETKNNLCLAVKNRCQSYEEALLEGIKEAIKILKEE